MGSEEIAARRPLTGADDFLACFLAQFGRRGFDHFKLFAQTGVPAKLRSYNVHAEVGS